MGCAQTEMEMAGECAYRWKSDNKHSQYLTLPNRFFKNK